MSNVRFYCGNLNWDATNVDLRDFFAESYEVIEAKILFDKETNRSRGFGFVELKDVIVEEVVADMDGREFMGRQMKVNEAQERPGVRGPARGRPRPRAPRNVERN